MHFMGFQFQLYLKGKEMWGCIDGSVPKRSKGKKDPKPTDDKSDPKLTDDKKHEKAAAKWEIKDAQIMSWISESINSQFILHLRPYKTAKAMWDYLKQIYH